MDKVIISIITLSVLLLVLTNTNGSEHFRGIDISYQLENAKANK